MRRDFVAVFVTALVLLGSGGACLAEPVVGLHNVNSIPMHGVEGRIDHYAADPKGARLFMAALENNTVEVIDTRSGNRDGTIRRLRKPAGVAFVPELNRIAVGCGEDDACVILDGKTLEPAGRVEKLPDADNMRYDAADGRLYCGYGEGAIAVIDPKAAKLVKSIELAGHPESFQLENKGPRILVNVPDARGGPQVAVVDRKAGRVVDSWKLSAAAANFPMAFDEPNHRLFIGCRKPAKVLVLDTQTGKVVASVDCVGDTDDLFYDAQTKRIYVSGGAGAITILRQQDADHYTAAGTIDTAPGARTSFFVPSTGRFYLAVPHRGDQRAEIRVFERDGAP
jgi:DNA-binding beta-propeller fold protein YncE